MKKRTLVVICALAALAALISVGTFAYYVGTQKVENIITAGNVDFEIIEVDKTGEAFKSDGIQVLPGDVVDETVKVKNTSGHPIFVRLTLEKLADTKGLSVEDCISLDINKTDWMLNEKDGYYYYKYVLEPGKESTPIFTKVSIDGEAVDNDYLGVTFSVNVKGDAVQSENNGEIVTEAVGWPETEAKEIK